MKIGKEYPSCRYWGYEPASAELIHSAKPTPAEKTALREQFKAERAKIKEAGMRSQNMGYPNVETATRVAEDIEQRTGVEMHVFNHDYL